MNKYELLPWWSEQYSYRHSNADEEVVIYRHRITQRSRRVWYRIDTNLFD